MSKSDVDTKRPIERFVNFSDAVVAIAITLLVLPLVDKVSSAGALTFDTLLNDYLLQITLFVISFLVIARFWLVHNSIFRPLEWFNGRLFALNMVWLLSIVIIPFTTELISGDRNGGELSVGIYIGTLFVTALSGLLMQYEAIRSPYLRRKGADEPQLAGGVASLILIGIALIISIVFPGIGLWSMLILVLSGIFTKLLKKIYAK